MRATLLLPLSLLALTISAQELWKDPNQPLKTRVADIVSHMTLQEKIGQMMNEAPSIPRLGIPRYQWWSESLHGLLKAAPCTSFPQCIGLGATFDTGLELKIATAISDEARGRFNDERKRGVEEDDLGLDFWAPNINIFRDPRWGRGQETYGEDPYLTGQMAIQFVHGMQGNDPKYLKAIATPKHFAVHSGPDPIRYKFDAIVSQRDLWLTYLPAFQNAVVDGGAHSIMGSYNSINGVPACANGWLLGDVLRTRWHFPGYVVSDCDAIGNIWADHHYVSTAAEAAAISVRKGCDLDCGGTYGALKAAVFQGLITEDEIDVSVKRLYEARFRMGLFDPPAMVPYTKIPLSVAGSPEHTALARKAADEAIVLLKNNGILPLSRRTRTVAVIGPNADAREVLLGNYNGQPKHVTSILEGIRSAVRKPSPAPGGGLGGGPEARITYAKGCDLTSIGALSPIPASALRTEDGQQGLKAEYFNNMRLEGPPAVTRIDKKIDFDWGLGSPGNGIDQDHFSARWTGKLTPTKTGNYRIGMTNDDGMRVWIDGRQILNDWSDNAARTSSKGIALEAGRSYDLRVEFCDNGQYAVSKLLWAMPGEKPYTEALQIAKKADVVVMVLGISGEIENESHDRDEITLPQVQQGLFKAVQALRKPIILVLVNGGPISLTPEELTSSAVVEAWYPGQEGGHAVADVLFGKVSPSGRMPVTVVNKMSDLPPMESYQMKSRTYRYPGPKPQFPFGFGLSYARFVYRSIKLPPTSMMGHNLPVTARVTNTGRMASDEIVQVYRHFQNPSKPMPERQLVAFRRIHLRPGETQSITFQIPPDRLSVLGDDTHLHQERGKIEISIGGGQPGFAATVKRTVEIR